MRTAKSIQQDDLKAGALNAIIDAQAKAGELTAARGTLNEVRKLIEKIEQGVIRRQSEFGPKQQRVQHPQIHRWQAGIALKQLQLGDTSGALVTAAAIDSDLDKARALMQLGANRMNAGKQSEAREMLFAASQAAQRVIPGIRNGGGFPPHSAKANMLSRIACKQAKAGDIKETLRTANTIPADQAMDDALAGIAPAQAEAGDLKGALETIARIRDESSTADALDGLAQILARAGHEKDALSLAAQQTSPVVKARALLGVILGKTNAKLPKQESPN